MSNLNFQVSAKTARLLGRENISDVDGAIVELVKNSYDADAECVFIKFLIPFNHIPKRLTLSDAKTYFSEKNDLLSKCYETNEGIYILKEDIEIKLVQELETFIKSLSRIVIIDNGTGMDEDILRNSWMNIGTNNKELNIFSIKKNRVKTGAKGIGRFALDKLSTNSKIITQSFEKSTFEWYIDWTQFDNVSLLNQVAASLESKDYSFKDEVKQYLGDDFNLVKDYIWDSGTIIILNPLRDFWTEKLFIKVNSNLRNLNPFGHVDKFNILVRNKFFEKYDYDFIDLGIKREDYDYLIEAEFNGINDIKIRFDRNEIDNKRRFVSRTYSENDVEVYDLNDFWANEIFAPTNFTQQRFNGGVNFLYKLNEQIHLDEGSMNLPESLGPFKLKFYYLKNQKSTVDIIREFSSKSRKKLTENFSGIKIYRDNFKIRPYGEIGQYYDWIDLSQRVQKSPAAASHDEGYWRVSPNQIIGSVSISRITNPKLEDNANREGMKSCKEYDLFVSIIECVIEKFEFDRQYPLREYSNWIKSKEKKHNRNVQAIYEEVLKERDRKANWIKAEETNQEVKVSNEELKSAVIYLTQMKKKELRTNQLLMILSGAGVMAQTFAHEITRIATNLGSRSQHIKESINRLLNYQAYKGDEDFNPYQLLKELDSTDRLLSEWVSLIMNSIKNENFDEKLVDLGDSIQKIITLWEPLLDKKMINIVYNRKVNELLFTVPMVDLHLLINNFLINSAFYLENAEDDREVLFELDVIDNIIHLDMYNNGPNLNEKYLNNPNEVFEPGESDKDHGTGLGLWIAREAVNRNSGTLTIIPVKIGFGMKATWKKQEN